MERERENVIELNDRPVIPLGRPTIHSAVALVFEDVLFIGRVWGEEQEGSHKWESGNNNNNCLLACGHHCSVLSVSILSFPQSVHLSLRRRNTQEGRTKSEMIITVSVPEMCVCPGGQCNWPWQWDCSHRGRHYHHHRSQIQRWQ